jgi:hypothetical protein
MRGRAMLKQQRALNISELQPLQRVAAGTLPLVEPS